MTAFAAANIAGSDMMGTGVEAFRLGIAGFLVPFAFVYHPELLLQGSWPAIVLMSVFAGCSAVALAAALVGHSLGSLGLWERGALLGAAALMVVKGTGNQVVGLAVFLAILAWSARRQTVAVPVTGGRL